MNRLFPRAAWHRSLSLCLLALVGSVFLRHELRTLYNQNIGYMALSRIVTTATTAPTYAGWLRHAEQALTQNLAHRATPRVYHGLGFVRWAQGQDDAALAAWRLAEWNVHDAKFFGDVSADRATALRWYAIAEALDPTDAMLWLQVGRICQKQPLLHDICPRFLQANHGNWLLDPNFAASWQGWGANWREHVVYAIVPCPELVDQRCATIKIGDVVPQHGASLQQCLWLFPGKRYRYSAWLRVETAGTWRPIYYQGDIAGVPQGRWPGDQTGSAAWQRWERTFVAEDFDLQQACFHPIRLLDAGQIWFYDAQLVEVGG